MCRLAAFVLALCICSLGIAPALDAQQTDEEQTFVSWVRQNAVRFDTLDWSAFDQKNLSILDRSLEGKRVVYLGEPDHYIHEKYDYRLILIRYLFEKGWRHIGNEIGHSDAKRIDQFIATGDPTTLERVAIYGYRGALRTDRDDFTEGLARIVRAKQDAFRANGVPEELWFARQLRRLSESHRVGSPRIQFFGFDVDVIPGGGYEDLQALLKTYSDRRVVDLRRLLKRVEGESIEQEIARLTRALDYVDLHSCSFQRLLGRNMHDEMRNSLLCLRDGFKFFSKRLRGNRPEDVQREEMIEREQAMCRQIRKKISSLNPGEKIILLGHNTHLSKDYTTLRLGRLNTGLPAWRTVGSCVQDLLPNQVYSIWMLYDHGSHSDLFCPGDSCRVESNADRIESLFSRAGPAFLLPLSPRTIRSRFLDENQNFICNGCEGRYSSGILGRQADAVFFLDEVTAMRPRQ